MLTEKNGRSVLFGKTSNQHLQLEGNNHEAGSITEDNYKDKEPKEVLKKYNKQKKKTICNIKRYRKKCTKGKRQKHRERNPRKMSVLYSCWWKTAKKSQDSKPNA